MLKSLELFGFKSFADRTAFQFDPGITCVVGPNGSGKSNVVDGLKWILGDQSPKSLRGKEMADVIFNGAKGRKPAGFSEATLTFDNSQGILPIESTEVQIGRRLYRSGDSEYLLNKTPVRLKDIRELFMGTGAGTAAYSIIEQGRVDQILQSNPSARRVVFEEAAGISRFRAKRVEAERRLERVGQNLDRLADIVDEVEAQLNATRNQAQKAARYRELSRELRELWLGLAADDFRRLQRRQTELADEVSTAQSELEEIETHRGSFESEREALQSELSEIRGEVRTLEGQRARLRETHVSGQSTLRHQSAQLTEIEEDLVSLRRLAHGSSRADHAARQELAATAEELEAFSADFEQRQQDAESRSARCDRLDKAIAEARGQQAAGQQRIEQHEQRRSELASARAELASQRDVLSAERTGFVEQLERLDEELAAQQQVCDERRSVLSEQEQTVARLQTEFEAELRERNELNDARTQCERKLAELRERKQTTATRGEVLQDLADRHDGFGRGPRALLDIAKSRPAPPWDTIIGSVGELLQVDIENAPLIEVALGTRSEWIVVRYSQPIVDHLASHLPELQGTVTFLDLSQCAAAEEAQSPDVPGVVGTAAELVQAAEDCAAAIEFLLRDTWIVEDLPAAAALIEQSPQLRAVTLQGELVTRATLQAGPPEQQAHVISRHSELRAIRRELLKLERQIQDAEAEQQQTAGASAAADDSVAEFRSRLDEAEQHARQLQSELKADEEILARMQRNREPLAQRVEDNDCRRQDCEQRAAELEAECEQQEGEIEAGRSEIATFAAEVDQLAGELERVREEISQENLELARHAERLQSLKQAHKRLERGQSERRAARQEAEQRLRQAITRQRSLTLEMLNREATLAENSLAAEQLQSELDAVRREHDRVQTVWDRLQKQDAALQQRRQEIATELHQCEMQQREVDLQLGQLAERMDEEFQLKIEDVAASEASAYRDWLCENGYLETADDPEGTEEADESPNGEADPESAESDDAAEEAEALQLEETSEPAESTEPVEHAPAFEEIRDDLEADVSRLRRKLKMMGNVNTDSLRDLEELEERFEYLSGQLADLREAKSSLEEIIRRINTESKKLFIATFEQIREHFQELYRKLFGGGNGDIILEDPDDVLECGIDIVARPPGKELRSLSLLSGGEKTLTAVALLLAMFKSRPSPYCILDEVDAALDDANVGRYVGVLREFSEMTQFVVITHRKPTMTAADVLYGVTMQEAGVSTRMSVRFDDIAENGEIRTSANAA